MLNFWTVLVNSEIGPKYPTLCFGYVNEGEIMWVL